MGAPSVGVIGAGIFGVAAAIELAELGIGVTLYDKRPGILGGATARNVFRVHRGYHYPRDYATAAQARDGYAPFLGRFAEALTPAVPAYYAIAAHGSLTTPDQFAQHCDRLGLAARPVTLPALVPGSVAACFEVDEFYYDARLLRRACRDLLRRAGVQVNPGWTAGPAAVAAAHDVVVVAAYAGLNEVLTGLGCPPVVLQYEGCEVVIVHAAALSRLSLVVMDGPFTSVAPAAGFGSGGYSAGLHLVYDVEHSVHVRATGTANPGLRRDGSRAAPVLASASRFVNGLAGARHLGSLYAERVVLPGVDATDARPTQVAWAAPNVLAVLSGKVSASVAAGREVAAEVAAKLALPVPEAVMA